MKNWRSTSPTRVARKVPPSSKMKFLVFAICITINRSHAVSRQFKSYRYGKTIRFSTPCAFATNKTSMALAPTRIVSIDHDVAEQTTLDCATPRSTNFAMHSYGNLQNKYLTVNQGVGNQLWTVIRSLKRDQFEVAFVSEVARSVHLLSQIAEIIQFMIATTEAQSSRTNWTNELGNRDPISF